MTKKGLIPAVKRMVAALAIFAGLTLAGAAQAAPEGGSGIAEEGVPWQGEAGISLTVEELMVRDRALATSGPKQKRTLPFRTNPGRKNNLQNPESPPAARVSGPGLLRESAFSRPTPAGPFTPQIVSSINFTGATLNDTNAFPPDSMGAAGPTQYIMAVNGRIRSFNKNTGLADGVLNLDTDNFFAPVMTPGGNFTTDPRIRFDRLSGRWFVVMIDVPGQNGDQPNRVMIAVSNGGTITNISNFTFFQFRHDLVGPAPNPDTNNFSDYPTLGIDANALYIGVNMFSPAGNYLGTSAFVVRKSSVLGAGPVVVTAFRNLTGGALGEGPFTPQGVDNYDPSATEGYFLGVDNATFGTLMLRRVSNPGGTPSISGNIPIPVNATAFPIHVRHLGNVNEGTGNDNGRLDALEDRLFAAHIRNGKLWTGHNIGVDNTGASGDTVTRTRTGSRWYELQGIASPQTPTVVQSGTVFESTALNDFDQRNYWIPSIMVSGQGHAAVGFSTAGTNEFINAGTVGRLAGDLLGTMETPALYTSSATAYNPGDNPGNTPTGGPRRWGDYSYTSLDPNDDMTMWTIQEFCNAADSYGVQVVKLLAPPPATPSLASPATVAAGLPSVNVVITGTQAAGSGFFDPGPGFPNRISASVTGGVTVNSVTFTDPSHVTLNISTLGATAGPQTVTITNPDGQSVASLAPILTITPAGSISGRVTDGAAGIPNARVKVFDAGRNLITSVLTDPIGNYTAPGVPSGDHKVQFNACPGFLPEWFNNKTTFDVADPVTVLAPAATINIDAALTASNIAFNDVPVGAFAESFIKTLACNGVTAGCGGGNFCPNDSVTRAQMAVFIEAALGNPPNACTDLFADSTAALVGPVVCGFIERLAADGITAGCGGGNFCPNSPVTRAQMAVFIEAALGNPPNACTDQFADSTAALVGPVVCGFIERLAGDGITAGCGGGNFCPNSPVTRAQMAVFLTAGFLQ